MSYDLDIYGRVKLASSDMVAFALTHDFMADGVTQSAPPVSLSLLNTASGQYAFTFAGVYDVEPEDVPSEVGPEFADATALYRVIVEGSREEDIPVATAFAEDVARRVDGRVVDYQTAASPREAAPAQVDGSRFVHAEWYFTDISAELAAMYEDTARSLFSQAVPVRFGRYSPMPGKLPRDGEHALDRFFRAKCALHSLLMKGDGPLLRGMISNWEAPLWPSIRLTFELGGPRALDEQGLQDFFVEFARKAGSFFAYVEVNERKFNSAAAHSPAGDWPGLPREPQWLTWFSTDYGRLVMPYLAEERTRSYPEGLTHRWSSAPVSVAEIEPMLQRKPWLPEKLLPTQGDPADTRKATRAARILPDDLRRRETRQGSPFGKLFRRPTLR